MRGIRKSGSMSGGGKRSIGSPTESIPPRPPSTLPLKRHVKKGVKRGCAVLCGCLAKLPPAALLLLPLCDSLEHTMAVHAALSESLALPVSYLVNQAGLSQFQIKTNGYAVRSNREAAATHTRSEFE